ncbi:uncharacterized protein [Branchiostoma lanceolatum]|uniref:uncharacterized protein n=1 Tax=Branchiostoma lanceolatum TaxID=7740 RepID=UPI003453285A
MVTTISNCDDRLRDGHAPHHVPPQVKATSPVSLGLSLPQIAPDATDPTLDNHVYPMLLRMSWPDSVLSLTLVDLVEHFGWDHVSIFISNDDYGTHGLVEFQLIAGQKGWRVHTMQSFDPTENPADIDVTPQLQVIKNTGARIIVLHCLASYAQQILDRASLLGMTGAGWAWVVSDGITGLNALGGGGNGTVPEYLRGPVGPRPPASTDYSLPTECPGRWRERDCAGVPAGPGGTQTARQ